MYICHTYSCLCIYISLSIYICIDTYIYIYTYRKGDHEAAGADETPARGTVV